MKVNIVELYKDVLYNIENNELLPYDVFIDWDCIDINPDWLVPGWIIAKVLTDRNGSPYLWSGYKGTDMRMPFYPLCFFSFFSGIMYSIVKNGNIVSHWDYWTMHKHLGSDFITQCMFLYSGISSNNRTTLMLGGATDFDKEGLMVYAIVHGVINHYFKHYDIDNFSIFDEDGFLVDFELSNLPDVLETFHRLGATCVAFSLSESPDAFPLKGKRLWGGKGMAQLFNYAR